MIKQVSKVSLYDAYRTIEWWKRQKLVCEESGLDYTMILEDDVYVKDHFDIESTISVKRC